MELKIKTRLMPLYAASFFHGLVFWYTVDKLVATKVGLTATSIAVILGASAILSIVSEIPSGILADRWSRKGVLVLATVFLGGTCFFGSIADAPWHYLAISLCWGAFYAMYSGTYEAMVYDMLIEESGDDSNAERYLGRVGQLHGAGLVLGSLAGGLLASSFGIHAPYYLSFLSVFACMFAILLFKEPTLHKHNQETAQLITHTKQTFRAVIHSPVLLTLFAVSASLGAMTRLIFEFNQLWYIKLHLPLVFFGIFNASVFLMLVVRVRVLGTLHVERFRLLTLLLLAGAVSTIGLTARNPYLAATAVTISMLFGLCAELVLITLQQKRFSSNVRAGAASVLSTAAHLAFIPAGFLFGILVDYKGISIASWLVTVLFILAAFAAHKARQLEHRPA